MDTTETYIKMCEGAEKIQELWKPSIGDWFYKRDGIGYGLWLVCKVEYGSPWCSGQRMDEAPFDGKLVQFMAPESYIWLPRQDQLQEMLLTKERDFVELLEDFYWRWTAYKTDEVNPWRGYIEDRDKLKIKEDFTSMEQLWLAFVMKEKYNKTWEGEDWK